MRVIGLVLVGVIGAAGVARAQVKATTADLVRLGWMSGCWSAVSANRVVEEHRMPLKAGTMVGMGRTSRGDNTVETELTIVRLRGDSLVYEAFPSAQPPAVFTASAITDSSVMFANPEHDFPQRIIYRRVGADSMFARVEGVRGGQVRGIDYPMRRGTCTGE